MCKLMKNFQLYTEDSRLLGDYYKEGESEGQHWSRMQSERIARNAENARLNQDYKHLHRIASTLPQLRAAEHKTDYR